MTLVPVPRTIQQAAPSVLPSTSGADSDRGLVEVWVASHRRSAHTRAAYQRDGNRFIEYLELAGLGLQRATLKDLLRYADSLSSYAPKSQKRMLSAVKALLTFGQKTGYLQFNVGAALQLEKARNTLAERILSEEQMQRMLAHEQDAFKHLLLRILYASGGRVSEVCALKWRDAVASGDAGQLTIVGKGGETRFVLLSAATWAELAKARPAEATADMPIFATTKGKPIHRSWALRIVKDAAVRAGLPKEVSPHWMRHAHASHALERGAKIKLVAATLGHKTIETTNGYLHARPDDSSARYLPV